LSSITHIIEGHSGSVFCCAFNKTKGQNNLLVTGGSDGTMKVWDMTASCPTANSNNSGNVCTYPCVSTFRSFFENNVQCLQMSESLLVAGSSDGCVRVLDFDQPNTLAQVM
jgi:WD40 repeat protein